MRSNGDQFYNYSYKDNLFYVFVLAHVYILTVHVLVLFNMLFVFSFICCD